MKALDLQYWRVTRVLFGGIELTLTDRWEEGAEEIEDGVSAPRSVYIAERGAV